MYQKKIEDEIRCPLRHGLQEFGGKWKPRIICVLNYKKTLRYSELRAEMADITDPVLAAALKELIRDNLVHRRSYDEIPPKVEYSLTERGKSVMPILQSICQWEDSFQKADADSDIKLCKKCDYKRHAAKQQNSKSRKHA